VFRLDVRLPIRHVGFELAQKCFQAGPEFGPVGRIRGHVDAARLHHDCVDQGIRAFGEEGAVGDLLELADPGRGRVHGVDTDPADDQGDEAQRSHHGIDVSQYRDVSEF
jgi:hypothetical protein